VRQQKVLNEHKPIGVAPHAEGAAAHCVAFYDWERSIGPEWLDLTEELFGEFGIAPYEGTGSLGDVGKSHGLYNRVRRKLKTFLGTARDDARPDIRVQGPPTVEEDAFFPCEMRIVFSIGISGLKQGMIAVREGVVGSFEELSERVGYRLFRASGAMYATAFDFPAAFGPDAYLSAVGAMPWGGDTLVNKEYRDRITRWRDNIWHRSLRPSEGYLREVYPINFVREQHLKRPLQGRPLSDFMERVGTLRTSRFHDRVYRWDVPRENLESARQQLEPSGLVLSSSAKPQVE
jgi:hypothetical protein